MLGLIIGLVIGFILGEHNAKLRFFYIGKRKKHAHTTQDVLVAWDEEKITR